VPTVLCAPGTYFDGVACIDCGTGYYSNFDVSAHGMYPDSCTLCQAGKYSIGTGNSKCTACVTGKLSSADRSSCVDCIAGQYAFNDTECVDCESGKYAPQALNNECLECDAGSHTNTKTKATTCTACDAGKFSNTNTSLACTACEKGKFSSSRAIMCTNCSVGYYTANLGSSTCTACASGRIAPVEKSETCLACDKGKYQGSVGQSQCNDCSEGRYAASEAVTSCTSCELGKTSLSGSHLCHLAAEGYYVVEIASNGGEVITSSCEKHSACSGGMYTPVPVEGYWVDHSSLDYIANIYKCSRSTCKSGFVTSFSSSSSSASFSSSSHSSHSSDSQQQQQHQCWNFNHFNSSYCADIQCSTGSKGPFCGSCSDGYIFSGANNACELCGDAIATSYITFLSLLFLAACTAAYFYWLKISRRGGGEEEGNQSDDDHIILEFLQQLDSGSLKVCVIATCSVSTCVCVKKEMKFIYICLHIDSLSLSLSLLTFSWKTYCISMIHTHILCRRSFGLLIKLL
jgi:hypothetical protein